jgi:hypothetical protein
MRLQIYQRRRCAKNDDNLQYKQEVSFKKKNHRTS